jgi:predicted  nucleic acid-binding Zn-ribbon protein
MDVCGDAMKVKKDELENLFALQDLIILNRKLEAQAKQLATGSDLEAARSAQLANSAEISQARLDHEALIRELQRLEADLALVNKRISTDKERLNKTAVARDALGIQHELETLAKRAADLEDVEIGLLEQKSESDMRMHELEAQGEKLEQELQLTKARVQLELTDLKTQFQSNQKTSADLRGKISAELLSRFDAKLARGLAVGRLQKNTCTACNMSITATALADLHQVPADELASCPECQAILLR